MESLRREHINKVADIVRTSLNLDPPVDVELAVTYLNGKIEVLPDDEVNFGMEAKIQKTSDSSFTIYLSREGHKQRKRFSIAHELGHLFLHMGYLIDKEMWESVTDYEDSAYYRYGYNKEEAEANEFAAAFLMPKDLFIEKVYENLVDGSFQLLPIAEYFDVSIPAVKNRGKYLGTFSWSDSY